MILHLPRSFSNITEVIYIVIERSESQCYMVNYNNLHYFTVYLEVVPYSALQCHTVQYSAVQCSTVPYSAVQCNTEQCSAIQCVSTVLGTNKS